MGPNPKYYFQSDVAFVLSIRAAIVAQKYLIFVQSMNHCYAGRENETESYYLDFGH